MLNSSIVIHKNKTAVTILNDIHLQVLASGHAISDPDWAGDVRSPMYARLYYILGGDPYIIVNGKRTDLKVGHCYLLPAGFSFRHACEHSMEQLLLNTDLSVLQISERMGFCDQFYFSRKFKQHYGETAQR